MGAERIRWVGATAAELALEVEAASRMQTAPIFDGGDSAPAPRWQSSTAPPPKLSRNSSPDGRGETSCAVNCFINTNDVSNEVESADFTNKKTSAGEGIGVDENPADSTIKCQSLEECDANAVICCDAYICQRWVCLEHVRDINHRWLCTECAAFISDSDDDDDMPDADHWHNTEMRARCAGAIPARQHSFAPSPAATDGEAIQPGPCHLDHEVGTVECGVCLRLHHEQPCRYATFMCLWCYNPLCNQHAEPWSGTAIVNGWRAAACTGGPETPYGPLLACRPPLPDSPGQVDRYRSKSRSPRGTFRQHGESSRESTAHGAPSRSSNAHGSARGKQ